MDTLQNVTLLVDGEASFKEILHCIDHAHSSILINMFIWRDDVIGNRIAQAVLHAAQRGVHVTISVDRVGMILEKCEESERSFFHRNPNLFEQFKIQLLRFGYPQNRSADKITYKGTYLAERLLSHPNIVVDRDRPKNDHSKYYIIDGQILIFGGVNIEDKEWDKDCAGRVYQDYMLKLEGAEYVHTFLCKLKENREVADNYRFCMNNKTLSPAVFEMYDRFLSIINGAQKELVIVMAYFAPIPAIVDAIVQAWKRGVRIRIQIPEHANFQDNSNRKTMNVLMKRCSNDIQVLFSPKMVHTKLIYNENTIMFGSCNITNRAFVQLGELDIQFKNEDTPLTTQLRKSVEENFSLSKTICSYDQIQYSPLAAWLEGRAN